MSDVAARAAVFALAGTMLDWVPTPRSSLESAEGFPEGRDEKGRPLRWLSCPDCLANDRPLPGCETCGGNGRVPDLGPDPMRRQLTGPAGFWGDGEQERRDKARFVDAQLVRLGELVRAYEQGRIEDFGEDPLDYALRRKRDLYRRGDYLLLERAMDVLAAGYPMRHLAWVSFAVERQPLSLGSAARVRLDETADWLAVKMLAAIAGENERRRRAAELLGNARPQLRPERIIVPDGLLDQPAAGRGRWANEAAQGQRNALVRALAAEGKTAGEISRRVGLTKRRVQQILADTQAVPGASGPAVLARPAQPRS